MFRVILNHNARKDLKKLDKRYLSKVSLVIDSLANNPFLGEKMGGQFLGSYRIKIPPIRVIYTTDFQNKIIIIRAIGYRGDIYK